jgi:hypothetical protein
VDATPLPVNMDVIDKTITTKTHGNHARYANLLKNNGIS